MEGRRPRYVLITFLTLSIGIGVSSSLLPSITEFSGPVSVSDGTSETEKTFRVRIRNGNTLEFRDERVNAPIQVKSARALKFARLRRIKNTKEGRIYIFFVLDEKGVYGEMKHRYPSPGSGLKQESASMFFDKMIERRLRKVVKSPIIAHDGQLNQDFLVCSNGEVFRFWVDHAPTRVANFQSLADFRSIKLSISQPVCTLVLTRKSGQSLTKFFKFNATEI
jgi:hypothetical protein